MNLLNTLLTQISAALLAPFESYPATGLVVWGALSGVVATYVFGYTSNQRRLSEIADQTRAQLLAIKLFKDDLRVTLQCQLALLQATLQRLLYSTLPMIVMMIPFVLVMTQLAVWYEHAPIEPGETTVVEMQLAEDAWKTVGDVELEAPAGVVVETESLRDEFERTLSWRIRLQESGRFTLSWPLAAGSVQKTVAVEADSALARVSIRRPGAGVWDRLLHPAESGFSSSDPVKGIDIEHAVRRTPILGLEVPWWATFLIASTLSALAVRRLLGVQF